MLGSLEESFAEGFVLPPAAAGSNGELILATGLLFAGVTGSAVSAGLPSACETVCAKESGASVFAACRAELSCRLPGNPPGVEMFAMGMATIFTTQETAR
jgi:hypothetical protein